MPDEHAAAPVLDVLKVEVEHLSGPQPALEHEEEHRPVTERAQRAEQCRDLVVGERPGQALAVRTRRTRRTGRVLIVRSRKGV